MCVKPVHVHNYIHGYVCMYTFPKPSRAKITGGIYLAVTHFDENISALTCLEKYTHSHLNKISILNFKLL